MEIRAKTKLSLRKGEDEFPPGTDVLLLGKIGDEWFAEFVVKDGSKIRYVHMLIHGDFVKS